MGKPYHKFVKTTPNPRATKKSSGELVGPPLLLPLLDAALVVALAMAELVAVAADIVAIVCVGI